MKHRISGFITGFVIAAVLFSGGTALAMGLSAEPSKQKFYVDGKQVQLEAYAINGYNYVKLGDLSNLVNFDLAYDRVTNSVYIGERPASHSTSDITVSLPTNGSKYIPKAGDRVLCDDGYVYEVKDVSRYDNNVFADGPVGDLPTPTCDWSAFPEAELPVVEVRHFSNSKGDSMFIRNLYETRRMQYTIYNALGQEPTAWRDGKPLATVALSIAPEDEDFAKVSWPWRSSDLEDLVHSRPNSRFYVEAWDYYSKGVFQYTRYCVVSL